MHIKQVIISGFRSYRDQVDIEVFSRQSNVIVGRNGSGKSNFFLAIQFVLSDEFSHLRSETKQGLLHEGTGPRVLNAFVEIVFDNSDQRLPVEKDEVRIRRLIGAKKDTYFIDNKACTRQDIVNMLESAGFSRSNPYYIVKQGKINELATAKDEHRLKLLREVAGTRVYDERKEESLGILTDSESKRDKIDNLLKYIEDRLKSLETEKEELKEYQKYDRQKRSLEYTIYDHESKDARRKLDSLNDKRDEAHKRQENLEKQQLAIFEASKLAVKKKREMTRKWQNLDEERARLSAEQNKQYKLKSETQLEVDDLRECVEGEKNNRKLAKEKLNALNKEIEEEQKRLEDIRPKFLELTQRETAIKTESKIAEQRRKDLYTKCGQKEMFKTTQEKDEWLKKEIRNCNRQIEDLTEQKQKLEADRDLEAQTRDESANQMMRTKQELEMLKEEIDTNRRKINEIKAEKDRKSQGRTDLWNREAAMSTAMHSATEELKRSETELRSMMGKSIMTGIDSVRKVLNLLQERGGSQPVIDGYYGLLIDNFNVNKRYFTAVEVTAGQRLFYHIVENDRVGTKILDEINRNKFGGEVNFLPLNRLEVHEPNLDGIGRDAKALIEDLQYDAQFEKAVKHIFGRTLICRSKAVATSLAKSMRCDCVTLDGDQVQSKGTMTGGFYDTRRSKLSVHNMKLAAQETYAEKDKELISIRRQLDEHMKSTTNLANESHRLGEIVSNQEMKHDAMKSQYKALAAEQRGVTFGFSKERQIQTIDSDLAVLEGKKVGLENQLGTELMSQLDNTDQSELDNIQQQMKRLKKDGDAIFSERSKLENEKNKIENHLKDNLMRKREELEGKLQSVNVDNQRANLESQQAMLKNVHARLMEISKSLANLDAELAEYDEEKGPVEEEIKSLEEEEIAISSSLADEQRLLDKIATKYTDLVQTKDTCVKKIRDLGTLPAEAFEKYQHLKTKQLYKKLEDCNKELKKYENVNKKALDQFVSFSEQKVTLVKRKEELDKGYQSIKDMIDVLDQRKYDAIMLTFQQVSKHFQEVFNALVPIGHAELSMKTMDGMSHDSLDGDEIEKRGPIPLVEQFIGVGIKVSFTGTGETREMQQLSGGQKSLVALALIFAIQKCDPAPFYLFDEIDAALDAQHRKAVADMMRELCKHAQFITTTFRPELLEAADKFYGVRFRNKVSHIDCVSKEEAYDFVEDDTTH